MKKIIAGLALMIFSTGCLSMMNLEERERMYGKSVPVITEHFAAKELRPGDTWKIYLKASDPDGDMKYIVAMVDQKGIGAYSASHTRIPAGNEKELSGYVYLNTMSGAGYTSLVFYDLSLTIQIQDKAGHYSQPVVFSLTFQPRTAVQESPPPGVFQDQDLGPILISLRTITAEIGAGRYRLY